MKRTGGWTLEGAAVLREGDQSVLLAYRLLCDASWHTVEGQVIGWVGSRDATFRIVRDQRGWTLNGSPVPGLENCVDLDLGFTPATNLVQIRRIGLGVGEAASVPVAWLDVAGGSLSELQQKYEKRGPRSYWYEAPRFNYQAELEVDPDGFVTSYPGLWVAER